MKPYWLFIFFVVVSLSCQQKEVESKKYFDIDDLIDRQIDFLIQKNSSITKTASVGNALDKSTFKPDSASWATELSVFRHLEVMNKPIYAEAFTVHDGLDDQKSNLLIRQIQSIREAPVKEFKIYYLTAPENFRKIEATITEQNVLYYTSRHLSMDFEDYNDQLILTRYDITGVQKMMLNDSVKFSITCIVEY